jgi:membrane carboxypeptidase/penicillin-binding protein
MHGITPKISTAIWVGFDDPRRKLSGGYQFGGTACAPIWGKMMGEVVKSKRWFGSYDFYRPANISDVELCEETGEPIKNNTTGQVSSCSHAKVYPVNVDLLPELYNYHHPVVKKTYDVNVGW